MFQFVHPIMTKPAVPNQGKIFNQTVEWNLFQNIRLYRCQILYQTVSIRWQLLNFKNSVILSLNYGHYHYFCINSLCRPKVVLVWLFYVLFVIDLCFEECGAFFAQKCVRVCMQAASGHTESLVWIAQRVERNVKQCLVCGKKSYNNRYLSWFYGFARSMTM